MVNNFHSKDIYNFGEYRLNCLTEQLFCQNKHIKLEPQLFNLLLLFVSKYGETITRQQAQDAVWSGRPVSDEAIRVAVKKLRDIFNDDAKAPRFIKTLPRQGYRWLTPVEREVKDIQAKAISTKKGFLFGVVVVAVVGFVLYSLWPYFRLNTNAMPLTKTINTSVTVEQLTSLPGSEIYADYHQAQNKLAFLHRDARNSPQQLYVKYIESGLVKRISWDKANYSNVAWSKDGMRLAFNRLDNQIQTINIVEFDNLGDVRDFITLSNPLLADKFVIEWMHDQSGLLLAHEFTSNRQHSIYEYSFDDDNIQALSSPNVSARGDYSAAQSHDGRKIAILREVGKQQVSLLVLEMETGNLLANKTLPFQASKLAWQINDEAIILSSFFGQSIRYILNTDYFDNKPILPSNSLDIFDSCGERCYVLRQHNGDFLDIQETPLSALMLASNEQRLNATGAEDSPQQSPPIVESGRVFRQLGAQDFPRYLVNKTSVSLKTINELVYVSLLGNELVFTKLDEQNQTHTLAKLKNTYQLSAMSVSGDANKIAGVADGRLFVLATNRRLDKPPVFLTNALEQVDNPTWHPDNIQIYLTSMSENRPEIVLFNTQTKARKTIITGFAAFQPLQDKPALAVGIDIKGMAWLLRNTKGKWKKQHSLTQIGANNSHHWQAINNTLYFSKNQGREAKLCVFSLTPESPKQVPKCMSIGDNRFRLSFDVHPSLNKILLVESLGAQSNIIKMVW